MPTPFYLATWPSWCGFFSRFLAVILICSAPPVHGSPLLSYIGLDHIFQAAPLDVPALDDSDTTYDTLQQKLATAQDQLKAHQPATIALTADDINSLMAHNPALTQNNIRAYVSLAGDEGRLQTSVPTDILTRGAIKGQYFNMDISFGVSYDPAARSVNMTPRALQVGDEALISRDAPKSTTGGFDAALMTAMVNFGLRQNAAVAAMLDQTQSVEIKNGLLVIRTR